MKRLARVAMVLALAFMMAGCASLPVSSRVHVDDDGSDSREVRGYAPVDSSSPERIIEGFFSSMDEGAKDNYALARQYVMASLVSTWNPQEKIYVYASDEKMRISQQSDGSFSFDIPIIGTLEENGVFTWEANKENSHATFSLGKNSAGQWRIISAPHAVWISQSTLEEYFLSMPIYFMSSSRTHMVADMRLFHKDVVKESAVRAVLTQSKNYWLNSALSIVDEEMSLSSQGIDVQEGCAYVHMSSSFASVSQDKRLIVFASLKRTLMEFEDINDVVLTIEGNELADMPVDDIYMNDTPVKSQLYGVTTSGELLSIDAGNSHIVGSVDSSSIVVPSYDVASRGYAVMPKDGTSIHLFRTSGERAVVFDGATWAKPTFDSSGWLFTVHRHGDGRIYFSSPQGAKGNVSLPWISGREVKNISMSPDGSRLIVVIEENGSDEMYAFSLERSPLMTPKSFGEAHRIGHG
ncbi:MAG: GerMN domain-containing protein, partial [Actinomycetaceae bacterium]|nr:GerMN domain-containing protein [Actinomycetaceae bacterium]